MERLLSIPNLPFDKFIDLCIDKQFIERLSTELHITKSQARVFLSAYTFRYFPTEILPAIITTEDGDIVHKSYSIINSITRYDFPQLLSEYVSAFSQWKKFDKPRTAQKFIDKYKQLRLIRNSTPSSCYYLKELKIIIDMTYLQLITMINSLGGEESLARIDNDTNVFIDETLKSDFIASAKEIFWTDFRHDLPSYKRLIPLLIDFANKYKKVIPNRIDLQQQLADTLDLELIQQRMDTTGISYDNILDYAGYIVSKIKEVDMPSEDQITDDWFNELKTSNRAVSDPVYFLQTFFEYVYKRLDRIRTLSAEMTPIMRVMYENRNVNKAAE